MKIEKGIPIPPKSKRSGRWAKILGEMEVGDSILLTPAEVKSPRNWWAYLRPQQLFPDRVFESRKVGDESCMTASYWVWRTK